jgi:acetolactate synthase-1/2/3 large subunit
MVAAVQAKSRFVDVFLEYLKAEGASVVFGIPGGLLHPFFEAIENDPDLMLIVARHEEGAAFMADGFARAGRKLAVCAGTSGPGSTNLLTGVSCAFADGIPMLVITGQVPSSALGKGAAQETPPEDMDVVGMFRPVTKYSTMITSPGMLSHHLRRALRLALTGRPGPVHLNVPVDLWGQFVEERWFDPSTYRPSTHVFDRNAVHRAAEELFEARRPVFLVGAGVGASGAGDHLLSLAELLPARVATTPRGKGLFPEDHPLSLGVFGFAGHRDARELLLSDSVDVLFTVGASLNETTTFNWHEGLRPRRTLIQLDIEADRIGRNYPVEVPLVGDAQTILIELIYQAHRMMRESRTPASEWKGAAPLARGHERFLNPELRVSDAHPLTPQRWRVELQEVLPSDAVVFSDIGGHMLFNLHHLCIGRQQRFFINLGFGSMGHGVVAPIGAALALPSAPVVTIVGDACFTMNGMELLTAAEYEIPVVWIVENNQMHGITWHGSQMVGGGRPMQCIVYRRPIEIASLARAMGVKSWVVDRPRQLGGVFREALAERRPALIEVRVDERIAPPLADRAKTIAGFKG